MLNKILTIEDFERLSAPGGYIDLIRKNISAPPKDDALIKHSSILEAVEELGLNSEMLILDAGCGSPKHPGAPLTIAKRTNSSLICIDRLFIGQQFLNYEKSSCYKGDFFEICKGIGDSTVDVIIDGCSITHFDTASQFAKNDGCYRFGHEAMRILKPGGYFVCCSDVVNSEDDSIAGEFITSKSLLEAFTAGGLQVVGDHNFSLEKAFVGHMDLAVSRIVLMKPEDVP